MCFEHYEGVTVCLTLYGSKYWFTDNATNLIFILDQWHQSF